MRYRSNPTYSRTVAAPESPDADYSRSDFGALDFTERHGKPEARWPDPRENHCDFSVYVIRSFCSQDKAVVSSAAAHVLVPAKGLTLSGASAEWVVPH